MREDIWDMLERKFQRFPDLRMEGATDAEIDAASAEIGIPFPADYRAFLRRYGGQPWGRIRS